MAGLPSSKDAATPPVPERKIVVDLAAQARSPSGGAPSTPAPPRAASAWIVVAAYVIAALALALALALYERFLA